VSNYPLHVLAELKLVTIILLAATSKETRKCYVLTRVPREPIRRFKSERASVGVLHNFVIFHNLCAQLMLLLGNILTPQLGDIFVFAQ